jgi:hypothetical protein
MRPTKGMPGHGNGNWNHRVNKVFGKIDAYDTPRWWHGRPLLGLQRARCTAYAMVAPHRRPVGGPVHGLPTVAVAAPRGGYMSMR